jgi:hypothetical protein
MACVVRLLSLALPGLGVLDDAIPNPSAGCIVKNGTTRVMTPNSTAGRSVGRGSHENGFENVRYRHRGGLWFGELRAREQS